MWLKVLLVIFGTTLVIGESITSGYVENYSRLMFYLSASAYVDDHMPCLLNRAQDFLPHKFEVIASHTEKCDFFDNLCGFFAVVSRSTKQMVISFRGTTGYKQLITEVLKSLLTYMEPFCDIGNVNPYFKDAYDVLSDNVDDILKNETFKDYNVTFTGHSLGAALASLAAARTVFFKYRNSNQVNLYTYGQPRVGNPVYAANYNRLVPESYRVVHKQDIVVHIPFCGEYWYDRTISTKIPCNPTQEMGQYHHGTEIWYPNNITAEGGGNFVHCLGNPLNEDMNCSDGSFPDFIDIFELQGYLKEHSQYFGVIDSVSKFGETCLGTGSLPEYELLKLKNEGMEALTLFISNRKKFQHQLNN